MRVHDDTDCVTAASITSADSGYYQTIKDAELAADSLRLSSVRHKPAGKVEGRTSDEAGSVGS